MCAGQTEVSQHWREFAERRATTASGHTHRPAQDRWAAQTEIRNKQTNNTRNKQRENTESVCVEGQFRRGRWHRQKQKKQQQWLTQISSGQEGLTLTDQIEIANKTIAIKQ